MKRLSLGLNAHSSSCLRLFLFLSCSDQQLGFFQGFPWSKYWANSSLNLWLSFLLSSLLLSHTYQIQPTSFFFSYYYFALNSSAEDKPQQAAGSWATTRPFALNSRVLFFPTNISLRSHEQQALNKPTVYCTFLGPILSAWEMWEEGTCGKSTW